MNKQTDPSFIDCRLWLNKEFAERGRKNPRFSLRAFAKKLGLDPSTLSQILSGKRKISLKTLNKVCDALEIPADIRSRLVRGLEVRNSGYSYTEFPVYNQLALDTFTAISEWYYTAILELCGTDDFQNDPAWISQKLGISQLKVTGAVQLLKNLGLLKEINGKLRKTDFFLTNEAVQGITSDPHKELQRQFLKKALQSIDYDPPEDKDITAITMAIDPRKLPEAKKMIKNFRRELCAYLEQGKRKKVYNLAIQLYPLSHRQNQD